MAYKSFREIEETDLRIYMAGLMFSQVTGFKTPQEFCRHTTLIIGNIDTDDMIFFSNTIDRDEKDALDGNTQRISDYFASTIPAYLHPDYQEKATEFFSNGHLRDSFNCGLMTDSIEYPCILEDGTMWIRACYNLEQDFESGHVIATIVLVDVTHLH